MGVQFNIKDPDTIRLARMAADKAGTSVTAAIREALTREVHRLSQAEDTQREKIDELLRGMRGRWKPEFDGIELSTAHGDLLYDDDGLPK